MRRILTARDWKVERALCQKRLRLHPMARYQSTRGQPSGCSPMARPTEIEPFDRFDRAVGREIDAETQVPGTATRMSAEAGKER